MKVILKNCLRRIVEINLDKKLLLEEYIVRMTATNANITSLLQENDASNDQIRQVALKVVKDDEENYNLLS